jgi:hypothetical protein
MSSQRFFLLFLMACGGGGNSGDLPDAVAVDSDPTVDMPVQPGACAYTEAADATNNNAPGAEATGIMYTAATVICGKINSGHFNAGLIDVDAYKINVPANSELLVHISGTGIEPLTQVATQVLSSNGMQPIANAIAQGDHGTTSVRLATGDYILTAGARNTADIAAPIDYRITLIPDAPATRCAKVTAAANFTEANDGGANIGNDMISIDEGASPSTKLTTSAADSPEPTALTLAVGTKYRITGSSAALTPVDSYKDKDTFLFTTGATTTQLSVRLNWAATTVDFDFLVPPAGSASSIGAGLAISNSEDEFRTFAVKPNSQYWLWVGQYKDSTATTPSIYDATICAEAFTP